MNKKYVYKPYSESFPELFQKEKARISSFLKHALAIEHVGSTAIPGLGGKGIIDIAIAVSKEDMQKSSEILQKLGYEFRPSFSTPDRFYFVVFLPDLEEGTRRYHIHLTQLNSKEWKELLGFRDYLLSHPEAVEEYANLKKHAAEVAEQDGRQYRKMKEPIFQKAQSLQIRILQKADIPKIAIRYAFPWSTPEKIEELWNGYYEEQEKGIRTVAIVEKNEEILGYGSLLRKSECSFFLKCNIPEVNAVWIDEDHRGRGLGTALIKWIEDLASKERYEQIGIGVGLYQDYGPAQRLYFRLGYIPDGNGITYKGQPTIAGQSYPLDDELILWLVKKLHIEKNGLL